MFPLLTTVNLNDTMSLQTDNVVPNSHNFIIRNFLQVSFESEVAKVDKVYPQNMGKKFSE